MLIVLTVLSIWVLLNILFVLIVVPPRKPRRQTRPLATTLSPAPIDPSQRELEQDEPFSLRHVVASVAMGAFFVLVPPLLALRDAIMRLFGKSRQDGSR
ncbi:hypothetical protein [Bradyrhizobium guangzhouense]|uniref:Uncharacterized protein n=1 Tax=Bradyrhizobium guangzhouense TaxID=1325095 RepID=A0AAE6CAH5_9BRAD|nr:hypothetical protein [Bradyrhizobium guangzhouense]QAU48699.1 hypothetical protein XH91_27315 [Bradyrhizobium guangzhouense]RXH09660.1 hypothetical protein EAS56_25510 [Bradyrhizobium guangzhouense]RXH10143.1 hypothetical protein EAS54_32375 [Bradyrhizobium guangzhouense]